MHSNSTLLSQLDDHLVRLLAAVTPERVCSERPDDDAPVRLRMLNAGPRMPQTRRVSRQVWHLRDRGLVVRDGISWSRTAAGDYYLTQYAGGS